MEKKEISLKLIREWGERHKAITGSYPSKTSPWLLEDVKGWTWNNIGMAMYRERYGLPKMALGAVFDGGRKAKLTVEMIRDMAERHKAVTGLYPMPDSEWVLTAEDPVRDWGKINVALQQGRRGLPGGSSLHQMFHGHIVRGQLTIELIREWGRRHFETTGEYPTVSSPWVLEDVKNETWAAIGSALINGLRGIPLGAPPLNLIFRLKEALDRETIAAWVRGHRAITGKDPSPSSEWVIPGVDESWRKLSHALMIGQRSLPGGETLADFVKTVDGRKENTHAASTGSPECKSIDAHITQEAHCAGELSSA